MSGFKMVRPFQCVAVDNPRNWNERKGDSFVNRP